MSNDAKGCTRIELNVVERGRECISTAWNACFKGVTGGCPTKKDMRKRNHESAAIEWGKRM